MQQSARKFLQDQGCLSLKTSHQCCANRNTSLSFCNEPTVQIRTKSASKFSISFEGWSRIGSRLRNCGHARSPSPFAPYPARTQITAAWTGVLLLLSPLILVPSGVGGGGLLLLWYYRPAFITRSLTGTIMESDHGTTRVSESSSRSDGMWGVHTALPLNFNSQFPNHSASSFAGRRSAMSSPGVPPPRRHPASHPLELFSQRSIHREQVGAEELTGLT